MYMLVDMIDPGDRNEVMVLAVRRALLGELDLVDPVEMVDLTDYLSVQGDYIHVLFDLGRARHLNLRISLLTRNAICDGWLQSGRDRRERFISEPQIVYAMACRNATISLVAPTPLRL